MGTKKIRKAKEKKTYDPALLAAVQAANFQWQAKKQAIRTMTVDREVNKLMQEYRHEVWDEYTDWMYGAFALALHRKHGFGAKRIAYLFDDMQKIKDDLIANGVGHEKIWDIVRDEIGLDITLDEEKKNE